jgi:hypothetical protein
MAKGQQRSNREAKKPKASKKTVAQPVSISKQIAGPAATPNKKA